MALEEISEYEADIKCYGIPGQWWTQSLKAMMFSFRRRTGQRPIPKTPDAVEGRRHTDIQTDSYLEELVDTVPEAEISTQTDPFIDRPPTPLFIPQKSGVDAITQIEQGNINSLECKPQGG